MSFSHKKHPIILFFIISFLCLSPMTTINSSGDLSTALSLLKAKLLSLASELGEKEKEAPLSYDDIKSIKKETLKAFHDFYFDNFNIDKDVEKLMTDVDNETYHITKIESLMQKKTICGYLAAFNGTEMYKKALANDDEIEDNGFLKKEAVNLTPEQKTGVEDLYPNNIKPYDNDNNSPTEFDLLAFG